MLQHFTLDIEGKLKYMDRYDTTKTNQDGIDLEKLIFSVRHLQDYGKLDVILVVEVNKSVYLFYQEPYQSNPDYLEAFKAHLKLIKTRNGDFGYYPGLESATLLEKHNITRYASREEQNIKSNINSRERYLTFLFLTGADNLMCKQLKTVIKNNYIVGLYSYPQYRPGVMKLLNNYIS